ncbi:nesprin-2-like [Lissotriton helveticus]
MFGPGHLERSTILRGDIQKRFQEQDMPTDYFTMVASHDYLTNAGQEPTQHEVPSKKVLEFSGCNICTASIEKHIQMEYAWQLWAKFVDCFSRYQDWLQGAEAVLTFTKSSQVLYADAKEELKKCEVLLRQVRERLGQLESLNRQYRQLTQINGIGLQTRLRAMVQECNQRWDRLQKQAQARHKRLKYFVSQREDFESEREIIEVWLIELDLKLTDVEHFSSGNTLEKIKQLQPLQQDVQVNADRVDGLLVFGEQLIQRSEPLDAECLEEELQLLSCYCQEVFSRVFRFRRRLVSMRLVFEEELQSDKETNQESERFSDISSEESEENEKRDKCVFLDTDTSESYELPPTQNHIHRCNDSTRGSLDLEWDPSVDVGGSTSHDEDDSFHSAFTGIFPLEKPRQRHRGRARPRREASSKINDLPGGAKRSNGIINSKADPNSNLNNQHCSPVLKPTERNEQPPRVKKQEINMNGISFQPDRPTFNPEQIETWLGQTHTKTLWEVPEKHGTPCSTPSTSEQRCVPTEYETNKNDNCCPMQQGTIHHFQQPKATSRLVQKPLMKQRQRCSQEVKVTMEKRAERLLPSAYPAMRPPFKKRSFLTWLKMLVLVSILLALLFLTGIVVLYILDSTCPLANRRAWSRHFMLQYVNGPPPT